MKTEKWKYFIGSTEAEVNEKVKEFLSKENAQQVRVSVKHIEGVLFYYLRFHYSALLVYTNE